MPSDPERPLKRYLVREPDADPDEALLRHLRLLDSLVETLKASPLASSIRVFGSAVDETRIPVDLDCLIQRPYPAHLTPEEREGEIGRIIEMTEGAFHGLFDPFRVAVHKNGREFLHGRGPRERHNFWIQVRDERMAADLMSAGRAGVPLLAFDRRFEATAAAPVFATA